MKKNKTNTHGGLRENSGRRPKEDRVDRTKITCMLRTDTVEKLHAGAGSRFFGEYLQMHLDRFPPPDYETYMALRNRQPLMIKIKGRKSPVIISAGAANRVKRVPKPRTERELAIERRYEELMMQEEG